MSLPGGVLDFLYEAAAAAGVKRPESDDDLFKLGVLDSFSLVDFISVLETECGLRIPDADVNPGNFQSINSTERYLSSIAR